MTDQPETSAPAAPAAGSRLRPWLAAAGVVALLVAFRALHLQDQVARVLAGVAGLGAWGPVVFVAVYVLAAVCLVPGSILTLGAGAVFGVLKGSLIVSLAATLGATAAFLVGRHLARGWVERRLAGNPAFAAIDEAVGREGWRIVGLVRLSPLFPYTLLNYAFGITRVRLVEYVLASWIGMIPGTLMYVYLGSLASDLATLGTAERRRTPAEWALYVVGLVATVAVTVLVTRTARRALRARAAAPPPE